MANSRCSHKLCVSPQMQQEKDGHSAQNCVTDSDKRKRVASSNAIHTLTMQNMQDDVVVSVVTVNRMEMIGVVN